ncbi:hypothetical protein P5V15_009565 [Pogonomyrmex californicus]
MWKIWLFHATDFQSLMYPCFIFSRILGIFPNKINDSNFKPSKQHYILSIILICIIFICDLLIIHGILISNKIDFGEFTENIHAASFYACSGFIAIVTHILTGPRMHLLQIILKISSQLPSASYQKLSKWIHIKDILYTSFLFINIILYFSNGHTYTIDSFFTTYITQLVLQMDMQYINYVCVIKACFKKINDDLVHIQKLVVNDKQYAPRLICDMQKNQLLLTKIKTLKKQHLMTSDAVQMLNVVFSLQLLATIVLTFIEVTIQLYFYAVRWKDGLLTIILDNEIKNMFYLIDVMYDTIKLILIVWTCETCKTQAFEIGTTIHDILNSTDDTKIKKELQLFSLQLLHCNNVFSAKGLTVDATLLTVMIGGITTYILILIQFMMMSYSCNKKFSSNITQTKLNPM